MAIYSLAAVTTATGNNLPAQEVIPSGSMAYRVLEYGLTISGASASIYGLGRAVAAGSPSAPVTVLAEDVGNTTAGFTTTAVAWGTAPTIPANFLRRIALPATIGAGTIWTFPRGITALKGTPPPGNNNLALWVLLATSSVANTWFVIDE